MNNDIQQKKRNHVLLILMLGLGLLFLASSILVSKLYSPLPSSKLPPSNTPKTLVTPSASPSPAIHTTVKPVTPSATPTSPPPPTGYENISNDDFRIAFALPENWTIKSYTDSGQIITDYEPSDPGTYYLFRVTMFPSSDINDPEDVIDYIKVGHEPSGSNYKIIDEYNISIAGQPATVLEYQYQYSPLYKRQSCILAAIRNPDQGCNLLLWCTNSDNEAWKEEIFEKMLPSIQFIP